MKYKIQTARGAAVGTHHFNDAKWSDKIFGYNGLTLDECRNELIDDIKTAADCDDEEFEECYTAAIDDVTNASVAELADDFIVFVDGREKAWRIVED